MADLNVFNFTGRLTKDAVMKVFSPSGKQVLTADVAVNTGYGDYKKTLFIKVQMWGDRGEKIKDFLKTGTLITSSGELTRNEWGDEGNRKVDFLVTVMNIQILSSKKPEVNNEPVETGDAPDDFTF